MEKDVIQALVDHEVKDFIENTIKNAVFSNQIKNYVGIPLWWLSMNLPSLLMNYRASGNKFFSSLPLKKIDMFSFSLIVILATDIAHWNNQKKSTLMHPFADQLAERDVIQSKLEKAQKLVASFNALIDCIQKTEGGGEKLVKAGLSKITPQQKSAEDIAEYIRMNPRI